MNPIARRYAQAQRETASPERLLVLLFQAALRNMRTGAAADARLFLDEARKRTATGYECLHRWARQQALEQSVGAPP